MVPVRCAENAKRHVGSIFDEFQKDKLTLNIPATNIGCKSSFCNGRFRSIFSIQSLTDLAFATFRKIPVVSGPL